jgi:hypothetical protein
MPKNPEKNITKWSRSNEAKLVHTLAEQKIKGNWGDNNPKPEAWTACKVALEGSEKESGGTPKTDKAIRSRWQRVCHYSLDPLHRCIHTSIIILSSSRNLTS